MVIKFREVVVLIGVYCKFVWGEGGSEFLANGGCKRNFPAKRGSANGFLPPVRYKRSFAQGQETNETHQVTDIEAIGLLIYKATLLKRSSHFPATWNFR